MGTTQQSAIEPKISYKTIRRRGLFKSSIFKYCEFLTQPDVEIFFKNKITWVKFDKRSPLFV